MSAKKISALSAAALPLTGAERLAGVQGSTTVGFTVDDLLATPLTSDTGSAARSLAQRLGEAVNVRDFGAGGGDPATDTAAIQAAWAVGVATPGAPHLYFPPGTYYFADDTLAMLTDDAVVFGDGAVIVFQGAGLWQVGDASTTTDHMKFRGLRFVADATSSVEAPLLLLKQNGTEFSRCVFDQIKDAGLSHRYGVFWLRHCDSRMMTGAGECVVRSAIGAGDAGAVFIQGGRFATGEHVGQILVDFEGVGTGRLDGVVLMGVSTADLGHVLKARPGSGGKISNVMSFGGLYDQVDQAAFDFAMPAGAMLGDVTICGNKINGWGSSTATSGGLISVDLTASGASHDVVAFTVTDNVLNGARARAFECKGGVFKSLIFSRNTCVDYGRQANAASRAAYITGTFDRLEVCDNNGTTQNTHDYDLELVAITATARKIEGNGFGGTAANLASLNNAALRTCREVLQADRTYYVRTDGSDSNAGLVDSAAGAFLTLQHAHDILGTLELNSHSAIVQIDDNSVGMPAYTAGVLVSDTSPSPRGPGRVIFQGNHTTPSNVLISTTSTSCFNFQKQSDVNYRLFDMKLQTATAGDSIVLNDQVDVEFGNLEFGACAGSHVRVLTAGSRVIATGNYAISGGAQAHLNATNGGHVQISGRTVTLIETPAFAGGSAPLPAFAVATVGGAIAARGNTFTGSATGPRYDATGNAVIDVNGAATTYLPGGASGATAGGGQYV